MCAPGRAIIATLALSALFLAGLEAFSRYAFVRMSRIESREERDYLSASTARPEGGKKTVLLLGNSLLGADVEFERLRSALAPEWDARRLYVENTAYYDLYYGLRRLYEEGARYSAVVVFLTPRQLVLRPGVRGDYFAYRLMRTADVIRVGRDIGADRTTTSNMFFANLSAFYGLRSEVRKVILGRLMSDLPDLMSLMTRAPGGPLADNDVYRIAAPRLRAYQALAASRGSRLILAVPPQLRLEGLAAVKQAAVEAGVGLIVASSAMDPADFSDGSHISQRGAQRYTTALIPEMRRTLAAGAN